MLWRRYVAEQAKVWSAPLLAKWNYKQACCQGRKAAATFTHQQQGDCKEHHPAGYAESNMDQVWKA